MNAFNISGTYLYINLLIHVINLIVTILSLTIFIEKASKVFDHVLTLFFIHWWCCVLYSGKIFVSNWYLVNFLNTWICVVAGRWTCLFIEQNNINAFDGILDKSKLTPKPNNTGKNNNQNFDVVISP